MTLDMSVDRAALFSEFGETVDYYADGATLTRSITAVVDRQPPAAPASAPGGLREPFLLVEVANDATLGISSAALDLGRACLGVALRPGQARTKRRAVAIVAQDLGMIRLEVR